MTLETMPFNTEKVKNGTFEWFQAVIEGYVSEGRIPKPSATAVKKKWEELTGQKIKNV